MFEFIKTIMDRRIEQIRKSETTKEKETNISKNANAFIISGEYLDVLKSSFKFLHEKDKIPKRIREKKMISEMEVKMNNLFVNFAITSLEIEIEFDDILALAVAYFNFSSIYISNEVNLKVAKDYLMKCIELLKGKELHCKVILTAIQVRLNLNVVYKKLGQLKNCYLLLDEALELYLNYTKGEDEYPDPLNIADLFYGENEKDNTKIFLTNHHMLTLTYMSEFYFSQPRNMHNFVIYIHNLLNKQLEILENSTESNMFICWADASVNLSVYFLYYDRFMEAKIHLAAADYMLTLYYVLCYTDQDYAIYIEINFKYTVVHTSLIKLRAMYSLMLLHSSKDKLIQSKSNTSCESNNIESESHSQSGKELIKPLTFVDLGKNLGNVDCMADTYVSNFKDAKIIFGNILKWLNMLDQYYIQNNQSVFLLDTVLYVSKAYKYYVYFEGCKIKQKIIIKRQIQVLEHFSNLLLTLQLQGNQYCKGLYFELAITYSTLLNMTSELNENKKITDEMRTETNRLVGNIIHNFNLFINMFQI